MEYGVKGFSMAESTVLASSLARLQLIESKRLQECSISALRIAKSTKQIEDSCSDDVFRAVLGH